MKTRLFLLLFVFSSALDTTFTFLLLREAHKISWNVHHSEEGKYIYDSPESYESNPISRAVLVKYGVEGMLVYKAVLIFFICSIVLVIHNKSTKLSFGVALFAFIITGMVAVYGLSGIILFHFPNII